MPKFKWWQWTFFVVLGLGVLVRFSVWVGEVGETVAAKDAPPAVPEATLKDRRTIANEPFPVYAATVVQGENPRELEAQARKMCEGQQFCMVSGWIDPSLRATAFPLTDRETAGVVFTYRLNRRTGVDGARWRCDAFEGFGPDECFSAP